MAGFFAPETFPFAAVLLENWQVIRDECLALDAEVLDVRRSGPHERYVAMLMERNGWMPSWQVGSAAPNREWLTYAISYRGQFLGGVTEKLPRTAALLARLSGYRVCALSKMLPFTHLAPHVHPELGGRMLTYHLGLSLEPRRSYLWVDGEFQEEREGHALVFDGSREHFALNMSTRERVIFYMEFDRDAIRID